MLNHGKPLNVFNFDWQDYLTRARGQVPADVQQDFELTNASESGGVTTLWFSRKRVTWDSEDLAVMVTLSNPVHVIST